MGVLLFKCVRCHEAMEKLRGPSGTMDSYAADELAGRWRRGLSMAIWKTLEPRGRGHTLEGLLWAGEATRGPNPGLPDAEGVVRWTHRWIDHLIEEKVHTESKLERHIGGWEPELNVQYPPDIEPFKRAFAAIADRLGQLYFATELRDSVERTSEDRHALRRAETNVNAAKKQLRTDRAVFDAIGAARHCGHDTVRKALEKSEKSRRDDWKPWERFVDYRQIVTATPQRPGTRSLFLDIEELERRYPGAWAKRRD